jgi:simple sugar transport system ATP-binding protein
MPDPAPAVLEMRGISKAYFGNPVLRDVSLALREGEVVALVGENGAGKSTLMNILFGMPVIRETGGFSGEVLVGGRPARLDSTRAALEAGIGMVHQEFMLLPELTVAENVMVDREPLGAGPPWAGGALRLVDRAALAARARAALGRVGMASLDDARRVAGLPVGHMQLIEIAREVDRDGMRALVLDEPTAVLAEEEAAALLGVVRGLARRGIGVLLITHRLGEVMSAADRVVVLRDGEVVFESSTAATSAEEIAERMVGRKVELSARLGRATPPSSEPLLVLEDLRVDMPGEPLRGLSLEVRRGEVLGLAGLAGGGKVALANGVFGLAPARAARALLDGAPLPLGDGAACLRRGVALISEDRRGTGLLIDEGVARNISSLAMHVEGRFLRLPALGPLALVDHRAEKSLARAWIERLGVKTTGPDQPVRRLSGGNQQKVCVARALELRPRLLLVSEPTRGIDVGAKRVVLERLIAANRDEGTTVVVASSELAELRMVCDRIAVIAEGRLAGILAPDAPDVEFGLLMAGGGRRAA